MKNEVLNLTTETTNAVKSYIKHADIHSDLKLITNRILFLNTEAKDKSCYARNAYFAKDLGKSERTIRRDLKTLKDMEYITIEIIRKGKYIVGRIIHISQSLIEKAIKFAKKMAQKTIVKKAHDNADDQPYVLSSIININLDTKEKKDLIYKYIKSKKEKNSNNPEPGKYSEVAKFWEKKKLDGNPRKFWEYNTNRNWFDIRNWKQAAIGWAKKTAINLAAFEAKKAYKRAVENYDEPWLCTFVADDEPYISSLTQEDLDEL